MTRAVGSTATLAYPRSRDRSPSCASCPTGSGWSFESQEGSFEPLTGQMVLDFEVKSLRDDVVRVLRPAAGKERAKTAYEPLRAREPARRRSRHHEGRRNPLPPGARARSVAGHRVHEPRQHLLPQGRRGRRRKTLSPRTRDRRAAARGAVQPRLHHARARERGRRGPLFLGAIEADPRFADAYFNLAMAYEGIGDAAKARPCWKHYLELEPTGTWAEIARKHL